MNQKVLSGGHRPGQERMYFIGTRSRQAQSRADLGQAHPGLCPQDGGMAQCQRACLWWDSLPGGGSRLPLWVGSAGSFLFPSVYCKFGGHIVRQFPGKYCPGGIVMSHVSNCLYSHTLLVIWPGGAF